MSIEEPGKSLGYPLVGIDEMIACVPLKYGSNKTEKHHDGGTRPSGCDGICTKVHVFEKKRRNFAKRCRYSEKKNYFCSQLQP